MNDATQKRIDRLLRSALNARDARNVAQRDAAQTFLITRADELRADRDALETRLTKMWRWLDARQDDQPAGFAEREDKAIAVLHDYERVCGALDEAAAVWLEGEAA